MVEEARGMIARLYRRECARFGIFKFAEEAQEDIDSALSCFFLRLCKLGGAARNERAIAVYAVRDVLFRENRKIDRERWSEEAQQMCRDNPEEVDEVEQLFPTAAQAVKTYSFRVFCRRLMRYHDAAELADNASVLWRFFKKNCLTKSYAKK